MNLAIFVFIYHETFASSLCFLYFWSECAKQKRNFAQGPHSLLIVSHSHAKRNCCLSLPFFNNSSICSNCYAAIVCQPGSVPTPPCQYVLRPSSLCRLTFLTYARHALSPQMQQHQSSSASKHIQRFSFVHWKKIIFVLLYLEKLILTKQKA